MQAVKEPMNTVIVTEGTICHLAGVGVPLVPRKRDKLQLFMKRYAPFDDITTFNHELYP